MIKNLYTRSVLLLVYFAVGSYFSYAVHDNATVTSAASSTQHTKPILAFDLHGVIFAINYQEVIKQTALVFAQWGGLLLLLNPDFWLDLVLMAFGVRQFEYMLKQYPLLQQNFENLSNITQGDELIPQMPGIIHALKQQGYKIYLFSNIAKKNFEKLQTQFPDLFRDFDGFIVAEPHDGWIQKPDKKAYQKFLTQVQTEPEDVIFIDDQLNNIKAAQELGFKTIHFTSPEQMLNELEPLLGSFWLQTA